MVYNLILLLVGFAGGIAQDPGHLAPASPDVFVELHVGRLAKEPLLKQLVQLQGTSICGQVFSQFDGAPESVDDIKVLFQNMDIDFWRDVERVMVCGKLGADPSWCVILTGQFDPPTLPDGFDIRLEGGREVWQWTPAGKDGLGWYILPLNSRTLILSTNPQGLQCGVNLVAGKRNEQIQALLENGRKKHLVTLAVTAPAMLAYAAKHTPAEYALWNLEETAKDMVALSMGLYFEKKVKVETTLQMNDAVAARKMRAQLCRWKYEVVTQLKNYFPKSKVTRPLSAMRFSGNGAVLCIHAALPPELIADLMRKRN